MKKPVVEVTSAIISDWLQMIEERYRLLIEDKWEDKDELSNQMRIMKGNNMNRFMTTIIAVGLLIIFSSIPQMVYSASIQIAYGDIIEGSIDSAGDFYDEVCF